MAAGEVAELQQLEEMLVGLHAFQDSLGDWAPAQFKHSWWWARRRGSCRCVYVYLYGYAYVYVYVYVYDVGLAFPPERAKKRYEARIFS